MTLLLASQQATLGQMLRNRLLQQQQQHLTTLFQTMFSLRLWTSSTLV
jgi:hypothetical protein